MWKQSECHNRKYVIFVRFWGVFASRANFVLDPSSLLGLFYLRVLVQHKKYIFSSLCGNIGSAIIENM